MQTLIPVLGIDDDFQDTELIIDALKEMGINSYYFFPDPSQFFKVFNDRYRVIIIDYNLPGMNGQAVLDRVLKVCSKCRAIIISGVITPEMHLRLQISGAKDFVIKKGSEWCNQLAQKVKEQLELAQEDLQDEFAQIELNKKERKEIDRLLKR